MPQAFSVCKVENYNQVEWDRPFCFIGRTDEECSLVCPTEAVPENCTAREDGWRALRIQGTLDFSLIGILARILALLAEQKIAIFVLSTYQTDYILTKQEQFQKALEVLAENGYEIV